MRLRFSDDVRYPNGRSRTAPANFIGEVLQKCFNTIGKRVTAGDGAGDTAADDTVLFRLAGHCDEVKKEELVDSGRVS